MVFSRILKCLLCHGSFYFGQLERHLKTDHRAIFYIEKLIHLTEEASKLVDVDLIEDYVTDLIIKHDKNLNSESIVIEDDDTFPNKSAIVENNENSERKSYTTSNRSKALDTNKEMVDFTTSIIEACNPTVIKNENMADDQERRFIETKNLDDLFDRYLDSNDITNASYTPNNNSKRPFMSDTKIQPKKKLKRSSHENQNKLTPIPREIPDIKVKAEPTGDLTWATIVPLIGGSAIGCSQSAGNLPSFHLSYTPFQANEVHLDKYWPQVPKYLLDQEPNVNFSGVDYVNAVCPCAGLSMLNAGRNKAGGVARGSDNETNKWMFKTSNHVLGKIKPKVFWGENAPGLFNDMGKGVVEALIEVGKKHGYSFSLMKTSSEFHGLPQKRMRTFYFFWNSPTVPKLNWKNTPAKNLLDFLNEIPKEASLQDVFLNEGKASERFRPYQFVLEREGLTHKEFAKKQKTGTISQYLEKNNLEQECINWLRKNYPNEKFAQVIQGGRTHIQYIEHCMYKKSIGKGYWDASPMFFDNTINAVISKTMDTALHPVEDRYLNVREMMHLMGLPHDFELQVQDQRKQSKKIINHIAQNVPVNTAKDWADEVKLYCEGKLPLTDYTFLKQDNTTQSVVSSTRIGDQKPIVNKDKKNFTGRGRREVLSQGSVGVKPEFKNPELSKMLSKVSFSNFV